MSLRLRSIPQESLKSQRLIRTTTKKEKTAEKPEKTTEAEVKLDDKYGEGVDPELFKLCETNNIHLCDLEDFVTRHGILSRPTPVKDFPAGLVKDLIRQFDDVKDDIYKHCPVPF